MTPGAAMAFITAGAASSIPAAIAVDALVKKTSICPLSNFGLDGCDAYQNHPATSLLSK